MVMSVREPFQGRMASNISRRCRWPGKAVTHLPWFLREPFESGERSKDALRPQIPTHLSQGSDAGVTG
jgi:hypothetical protein